MTFNVKFNFKVKIRISKFGPRMHLSIVKVPIDFGLDWPWSSVSFLISNLSFSTKHCVSYSFASVCIYLVRPSPANAPHSTGHHIYIWIPIFAWTGSRRGPWNSLVLYLGGTIWTLWAVDSAISTGFYKLLSVFANLYTPHMTQFYMPTFDNHRNNSKAAPISLIRFDIH